MIKAIAAATAAIALTGCASVMNDTSHGVRIDTRTAAGDMVNGADCVVSNDYGSSTIKSGLTQAVRRSSRDLEISCSHPGQPPALGRAMSRANMGLAGNIILGGVVGAVVDHHRGTAYTYPTWIEMTFGQTLVFDRGFEKEGKVLKGQLPGAASKGPPLSASSSTSHACMYQVSGTRCD